MSVIIGAGTSVGGFSGVVSVSWNISPNVRRLWELGSFNPYLTIKDATQTVNVTCYGGGGPSIHTTPATQCEDSSAKFICSISPAACESVGDNINGNFYLTSYSYNKGDPKGPGQATYGGQQWIGEDLPSIVLCGGAEGTAGGDADPGVTFSTIDGTGSQGSVSAGFPGLGNAQEIEYGVVSNVDSGDCIANGKTANASVTVKHTPLYLD